MAAVASLVAEATRKGAGVTTSQEVASLLGVLLKYTAQAKDDTIDTVVALESHGDDSWSSVRGDATRALGAIRCIQDIALELGRLLEKAPYVEVSQ